MKNVILVILISFVGFSLSGQSKIIGLNLDGLHFARGVETYKDEAYRTNPRKAGGVGIGFFFENTIHKKISVAYGLNWRVGVSRNYYEEIDVRTTTSLNLIDPTIRIKFWLVEAHRSGFFLAVGAGVPVVLGAQERVRSNRGNSIEINDYKDHTQQLFPYGTLGLGLHLNLTDRIGGIGVGGISAYTNAVDKIHDSRSFVTGLYFSMKIFYRFGHKDATDEN